MRFALTAVAFLCLCAPSEAQTVPEFETFRWCMDKIPLGSYDVNGVPACVDLEEREAAALQSRYRSVSAPVRADCERYAFRVGNGWGSYSALAACITRYDRRPWRLVPQ